MLTLRTISGIYYNASKKYALTGVGTFAFYAIASIAGDIILKIFYRDLFDMLATKAPSFALWPMLWSQVVYLTLIVAAENVFRRLGDYCIVYHQTHVMRDLTNLVLEKLQKHSYGFFTGNFTGSLVTKLRRFVHSFEIIHDKLVYNFWSTSVLLTATFITLLFQSIAIAMVLLIWVVLYLAVSYAMLAKRMQYDLEKSAQDSKVTGQISDIITNILNVKIFSSSKRELKRFANTTEQERVATANAWNFGNKIHIVQGILMSILEIVGIYIALRLWMNGSITLGTVLLVQLYFTLIINRIWDIGNAMSEFLKAFSDAKEMAEIIELRQEIADPKKPEQCNIQEGTIEFSDVSFCYVRNKSVLTDLNLTIPTGEKVGIVGHSGAGKSTLFKLLLRFLDISQGSICIDGQSIKKITQDDLRKHISYVPQDPILFHRSLFENIAYGNPIATKWQVVEAAKKAHADDFISQLQDGYNTLVGERGIKLSGGERQRIAIARAILKDAPILLLDEATSALDSMSEKYIQAQLATLMNSRTTLAIAHRISTIQQMDRIIVMGNGGILENGSHEQLLKKKGVYASLWEHQSEGFLLDES